jgi:gamma-glutamyl phosphate reductase
MADQYIATDKQSGLEVSITGTFPAIPEDRMHVARTANLFTRLLAAGLATENDTERRELFTHLESQLELAAALIKEDAAEVQRLMQEMLSRIGLTPERMEEMAKDLAEQLKKLGDDPNAPLDGPFSQN